MAATGVTDLVREFKEVEQRIAKESRTLAEAEGEVKALTAQREALVSQMCEFGCSTIEELEAWVAQTTTEFESEVSEIKEALDVS